MVTRLPLTTHRMVILSPLIIRRRTHPPPTSSAASSWIGLYSSTPVTVCPTIYNMNQQVTHGLASGDVRYKKISTLQWRIISEVVASPLSRSVPNSWGQDELSRTAWIRAVSRLVRRGILVRERDGSANQLRLAVSEDDLYCGAMRAWDRDEARGKSMFDSPARAVIMALKERAQYRHYVRPAKPKEDIGWKRPTAPLGAIAAAIRLLARRHDGDIHAQEIMDLLGSASPPMGFLLLSLDQLRVSGEYARILADARGTAP